MLQACCFCTLDVAACNFCMLDGACDCPLCEHSRPWPAQPVLPSTSWMRISEIPLH